MNMSKINQARSTNKAQSVAAKHCRNQRIVGSTYGFGLEEDVSNSSSPRKIKNLLKHSVNLGHTLSEIALRNKLDALPKGEASSKDSSIGGNRVAPITQFKGLSNPIQLKESEESKKIKQWGILPQDEGPFLGHLYAQEFDRRHLRISGSIRRDDSPYGRKHHSASFQVDHGVWGTPGRDARIGSKGDARAFGFDTGHQNSFGIDGGLAGANYDFSVGDDGFATGTGTFYAQRTGSVGNISSKDKNDERLRLGGSWGVGFGFRANKSDKDKDNIPEYNYGFDLGPLSFDMSTEDPLLTLLKAGIAPLGWGLDWSTSDENTNLTHNVWNWGRDKVSSVKEGTSNAWNWSKDKASDAKKGASDAWDWTKDKASSTKKAVSKGVSDTWDWTKDKASDVKRGVSDTWDWTKEKASSTKKAISKGASDAWDWTKDKASDVKKSVSDAWKQLQDWW